MKKTASIVAGFCLAGSLLFVAQLSFAEGYTYIDTNNGDGPVVWANTDEPADGPPIDTIIAQAKRLFPSWITEKNMLPVKAYFVKSYNEQRKQAANWQPIDHLEALMIGITEPVNGGTDYYLYNCEVHFNRAIGQTKWVVDKTESNMTLGDGTPKMGGIHLIAADGTDKTQAGIADQTRRDEEEYARAHANDNDSKKKPAEASVSSDNDKPSQPEVVVKEEKTEKKKALFNKLKGLAQ